MTLVERINYYAKGVVAIIAAIATFGTVLVGATSDGHIDGGELSTLGVAFLTLVAGIIGVIKKRNIDPRNPEA